jgi:hypothetical protein
MLLSRRCFRKASWRDEVIRAAIACSEVVWT